MLRAILLHPYGAAATAIAIEAAVAFAAFGTGVDGLQALARYSGRAGLVWFALVFSISPWHQLARSQTSKLALRRRRHLGLAFGSHHLAHLAFLVTYNAAAGNELAFSRIAAGGLGYAALVVMMATSTDAAVARLGSKAWKRLHRTCLWYIWHIFFLTYAGRLAGTIPNPGGGTVEFLVCISIVLGIAGLRAAAFATRSRRRNTAVAEA
jgi:sulfoxide reductase heme-binding subunit YedZ